ncbi:ABC transporter permease, partial [Polymorphobacter multimanifer]|uniref:ABC transporter permease n=1 Tax=Polymorphobacter multimanifer TaxID=1070431 RepID=UPI001A9C4C17
MGQYAFRPPAALGPFDPGLSPWLGQAVWIEAHYQNPPQARPAQSAGLVQRFRDLSPAWTLQALMPLPIVMAGLAAIAGEREGGNLRLQLMQGARPLPLLAGKAGAMFGGAALLVTGILLVGGGFTTLTGGINADGLLRLASAWVVYLLYAAVWAALTVGVSALAATARGALLALLCLWMTSVVLVPRLAAEQAIRSHPVPSAG